MMIGSGSVAAIMAAKMCLQYGAMGALFASASWYAYLQDYYYYIDLLQHIYIYILCMYVIIFVSLIQDIIFYIFKSICIRTMRVFMYLYINMNVNITILALLGTYTVMTMLLRQTLWADWLVALYYAFTRLSLLITISSMLFSSSLPRWCFFLL